MAADSLQPRYRAPAHDRPLWRTAWRRLRRRPLQYLLFIFGVALGVAMMVSIDLASESAGRAFELSTSAVTGKATHRLVGGPAGFDEEIYRRLRVEEGFDSAAPVVEGYVMARELGAQPLRLVGVDPFAEPPFRTYLSGGDIGALAGLLGTPNGIALSEPLATRQGLSLGDSLRLTIAGREETVQIVALLQPSNENSRRALNSLVFADIATAQELLDMVGRLSHVDLIVNDSSVLASLGERLPAGVVIEPASARSNAVQQMTAAFELNLTALSLLALVVGMFLIYNTVSFSVVQRRPLFGVLRSLGVTGRQLFRLILVEAIALSLVGSLLGLLLGILLGQGMVRLVTQTINDIYFVVNVQEVAVPPASLIKGVVIGVSAAVLAALLPAWEALRTDPLLTLRRSTLEGRTRALLPWLVVAWALISALGLLLLWWRGVGLVPAFAGLFAILLAFALLAPPITGLLMRVAAGPGYRLFGVLGRMAPRDIQRSLSRTSVAIAALMVAVSVIIGVSIMIGSFRLTVEQWLGDTLQADVFLAPPSLTASTLEGALPADALATAGTWPGVAGMVTAQHASVMAPAFQRPVELIAVSGDVSAGQRRFAWLADSTERAWEQLLAGEAVFISEPLLLKEELHLVPQSVVLETPDGERSFPIVGVYYDYASDQGTIMIGQEVYQELWLDTAISTAGIFVEPGYAPEEVAAELTTAFQGRPEVVVTVNEAVRNEALAIFDRTFAITTALRLLAALVAFIGVLSALMSLQLERAREIGVLRAAGMTFGQFQRLTLLETGLMGVVAGLLAMPTGLALALILVYVINVRSFGWTLQLHLEPGYFLQALVVALAAALLAGLYPARRIGRMVIADALRQE